MSGMIEFPRGTEITVRIISTKPFMVARIGLKK